jgi:hypothetical protein
MCCGQAAFGRFAGNRGLGYAGNGDASSPGNGFDLDLQRLDLLLERNHLPQVGHRKVTKRFHLSRECLRIHVSQTHLLCWVHAAEWGGKCASAGAEARQVEQSGSHMKDRMMWGDFVAVPPARRFSVSSVVQLHQNCSCFSPLRRSSAGRRDGYRFPVRRDESSMLDFIIPLSYQHFPAAAGRTAPQGLTLRGKLVFSEGDFESGNAVSASRPHLIQSHKVACQDGVPAISAGSTAVRCWHYPLRQ